MKLWIDDERPTPKDYAGTDDWAHTSIEAINMLRARHESGIRYEEIDFDHDLSYDYLKLTREEANEAARLGLAADTSRPVLNWMIENDVWPDHIYVHTGNPIGRSWLVGTARRYAPDGVTVHA